MKGQFSREYAEGIGQKIIGEVSEPYKTWSLEDREMRKSKVVPLRIPENLDELAALSAQDQHTDKATALRQWMHQGAAEYVLKLVADGRISVGRAAALLNLTVYDLYHLAKTRNIEIGATDEQRQQSRALAARLSKKAQD